MTRPAHRISFKPVYDARPLAVAVLSDVLKAAGIATRVGRSPYPGRKTLWLDRDKRRQASKALRRRGYVWAARAARKAFICSE